MQVYTKSGGGGTLPVGLGQAGGGIFFIVDALKTKQEGYDVSISFPKEGIGTAAEGIALIKGAKNAALGRKLIDWATSPAMQSLYAKYKINFVPAHPEVKLEPGLAAVLKGAKIFPIDDAYAGANRKRVVERWVAEVECRDRDARDRARGLARSAPWRRRCSSCGRCSPCSSSTRSAMLLLSAPSSDGGRLTLEALLTAIYGDGTTSARFANSLLLAQAGRRGRHRARLRVRVRGRAGGPAASVVARDRRRHYPAADFAAVHHRHRVIFSFGPRGLVTYDLLGLRDVSVYGLGPTLLAETLTYFPIAYLTLGHPGRHRRQRGGAWPSASAPRGGACSAR